MTGYVLDPKAWAAMLARALNAGLTPTHDCRLDGHVVAVGAIQRCIYCGRKP